MRGTLGLDLCKDLITLISDVFVLTQLIDDSGVIQSNFDLNDDTK